MKQKKNQASLGKQRSQREIRMERVFYSLQDFMLYYKSITYIVMGIVLIALPLFWRFLSGRDEKKRTY